MAAETPGNRLSGSKSPYLLEHAGQPVDWFPWSDEAFARARATRRPIFLSIGYSSCHWCHVMSRESFEDREVAELLNRSFVCIKVDREERPDLDDRFMTVCTLMTGRGGWPLSVFLTPGGDPFHAATYLPKEAADGFPGFLDLLRAIAALWERDPARLERGAEVVRGELLRVLAPSEGDLPDAGTVVDAWTLVRRTADQTWGGFGTAPKFPSRERLRFLMDVVTWLGDPFALQLLTLTLERMMWGGIRDQIGGGYHRYAVDRRWQIPHFEKMLPDQALLAGVYTDAFLLAGRPTFLREARSIIEYVLQDLDGGEGGFFSSRDADSQGEEGAFYLWTRRQVVELLGDVDGSWIADILGLDAADPDAFRVPRLLSDPCQDADSACLSRFETLRERLWRHRQTNRPLPALDGKVVTEWNGLMIAAMADLAVVSTDASLLGRAKSLFGTFVEQFRRGELCRTRLRGEAGAPLLPEDLGALARAAISLHVATLDRSFVDHARTLLLRAAEMLDQEANSPDPARRRSLVPVDGALPHPVSSLVEGAGIVWRVTADEILWQTGSTWLRRFGGKISKRADGFAGILVASRPYGPDFLTVSLPRRCRGDLETIGRFRRRLPVTGSVMTAGGGDRGEICSGRGCHGSFRTPEEMSEILCSLVPGLKAAVSMTMNGYDRHRCGEIRTTGVT